MWASFHLSSLHDSECIIRRAQWKWAKKSMALTSYGAEPIHGTMNSQSMRLAVFETVGTSGQITLGKRYAGRQFEVEERLNGEILLRPVQIVRESAANNTTSTLPEFEIVGIDRVRLQMINLFAAEYSAR